MDIGVTRADDNPVIAVMQQIAIESVRPSLYDEEAAEQHRAVSNRYRRHRPGLGAVVDVAVHPVYRSGEKGAQEERDQHPILNDNKSRQRKEIEANVRIEEWVIRAVGHLIEEPQEYDPVMGFSPSDKRSEQAS